MSIEEGKQEQAPAKRNSRIVTLPKEDINQQNQMLNLMNKGNSRTVVHQQVKIEWQGERPNESSLVAMPHTRNDEQPTIKMRNLIWNSTLS